MILQVAVRPQKTTFCDIWVLWLNGPGFQLCVPLHRTRNDVSHSVHNHVALHLIELFDASARIRDFLWRQRFHDAGNSKVPPFYSTNPTTVKRIIDFTIKASGKMSLCSPRPHHRYITNNAPNQNLGVHLRFVLAKNLKICMSIFFLRAYRSWCSCKALV